MKVSILISKLNKSPFLEKKLDSARQQKYGDTVCNYMHTIYSNFTTNTFAEIINDVIEKWPHLEGVYQVLSACNFTLPSWTKMVQQMVDDPTPYHQWRV